MGRSHKSLRSRLLGILGVQVGAKLMSRDLPTGSPLNGDAPFGGDSLGLGQGVVDSGLIGIDEAGESGLPPQKVDGTAKRDKVRRFAHAEKQIDFSMPKSIENAMALPIDESISFAAMQTYGQRVKAAREHAGLSQKQLGQALGGLKQPSVLAIEKRETKSKYTLEIARITGVRAEWLEDGRAPMLPEKIGKKFTDSVQEPVTSNDINLQQMIQDVPILGGASCGDDGLFELNGQILGFARRPPKLVGVKDIYALYVYGDSMVPWREPRSIVFVHPHQPIEIGDYVVVQLVPEKGTSTPRAYLKRLVRRTADSLRLHQYNPPQDISLPMKRVKSVHRVMDWSELLGL
jgi:phage repressor protein C with HTH and peptisase S24 domain